MKSLSPLFAFALLALPGNPAFADTPGLPVADRVALELTFDDAPRTGLALLRFDGSPADLLTRPGGVVGADSRARAFDNSAVSIGMGGSTQMPGEGGRAQLEQGSGLLKDARSFTIQGWYRSSSGFTPSNYARLFSSARVSLHFDNNDGRGLAISINRDGILSNDAAFRHADRWIFFAVTYDATSETDNVAFYAGGQNAPVRLVTRSSLAAGPVGAQNPRTPLVVGNTPEGNRPFAGLIDNVRLWTDSAGGGAVLDLAALERVRRSDLR
jgi:hypothetical protein